MSHLTNDEIRQRLADLEVVFRSEESEAWHLAPGYRRLISGSEVRLILEALLKAREEGAALRQLVKEGAAFAEIPPSERDGFGEWAAKAREAL